MRKKYRLGTDRNMGLLRTLLAIAVVFAHTPHAYVFVGGQIAVQMFYMISGFLISFVLFNTPAYQSATTFWINRILRLFPVYYVIVVLTLIGYIAFNPAYWTALASLPAIDKLFAAIANVILFGQDWTFFIAMYDGSTLPEAMLVRQAWTLGVELSFYLIAPFVIRRPWILGALFTASVAARLAAVAAGFGSSDPWTYRFFPFELALFIAGAASHQWLLQPVSRLLAQPGRKLWPAYALAGIVAVGFCYFPTPLPEVLKALIAFAALFFALPFLFIFQARSAVDRYIGDLSYPIYIGHLFFLLALAYLVKRYGFLDPLSWARAILGVAGSIAFAVVLKFAVADPAERWRTTMRRKKPTQYSAARSETSRAAT